MDWRCIATENAVFGKDDKSRCVDVWLLMCVVGVVVVLVVVVVKVER